MKNTISNVLVFSVVLLSYPSYSSHIIGGEIYYECQGYGNNGFDTTKRKYLITIKLYRDCYGQTVPFDSVLGFTIYRQTGNGYVNTKAGAGINAEYRIPFSIPLQQIDPPTYQCLDIPKHVCGESGTYQIEVELPIITDRYVIVWQRCCRNFGLSNIKDPGKAGATFTIEIHPEAQRTCNSSPRFKNFPPTVLCVDAPFHFDHSAIDQDGDQLVYAFCESLKGGDSNNDVNGCKGGNPSPDCPPPYLPVEYVSPYTAQSPLGGILPIGINSFDGIIKGTPSVIGQFVVSVCVYEYRKGVLLSVLKRDFQFNVAYCEGAIVAKLSGKETGTRNFELHLCKGYEFTIPNRSTDSNYIDQIKWTYENGARVDTFIGWTPTIKFEEPGVHLGKFVINPGSNCTDSAYFRINVVPDIKADYTAVYDTCKGGPVQFVDKSSSTYSKIQKWQWKFQKWYGPPVSNLQNPVFQYDNPGYSDVYLVIEDNYGCIDGIGKRIEWFPAPDVSLFRPNVSEGCTPLKVKFRNAFLLSSPFSTNYLLRYKFYWEFSDGKIDSGYNIEHEFNSKGKYGLRLKAISPNGCTNEQYFDELITVSDPPIAAWSIDKDSVNVNDPVLFVADKSIGTIGRTWIVNGKDYYFDSSLQIILNDTGLHHFRMIATDRFLCTDTLDTDIYVYEDHKLFMPNAFTPNGDGRNDDFGPVGDIQNLQQFQLIVFDKWGSKLYSSSDPQQNWNGANFNNGDVLPSGIYLYELLYKFPGKELIQERKMVTLIK